MMLQMTLLYHYAINMMPICHDGMLLQLYDILQSYDAIILYLCIDTVLK